MSVTTRLQAQHAKKAFIAAFAELGIVGHAAKAAGVHRVTVYDWLEHDEQFAIEYRHAELAATESLEREAVRRAIAGSDTMLIFLLKARKPAMYRERYEVHHTGELGIADSLSAEQREAVRAALVGL